MMVSFKKKKLHIILRILRPRRRNKKKYIFFTRHKAFITHRENVTYVFYTIKFCTKKNGKKESSDAFNVAKKGFFFYIYKRVYYCMSVTNLSINFSRENASKRRNP